MECMLNLKICLFNHIQIVFTNHKYVFHNTIYKVIEIFHLELCNLKKIYAVCRDEKVCWNFEVNFISIFELHGNTQFSRTM